MPDTFFTSPPHWTWWIAPYFFVGGIAGGSFFIAALLDLFGRPEDRRIVRIGYYVATIGAIISGVLLILDLTRPGRFWHMLFESENFPALAFKWWSPISIGSWALLLFGGVATVAALGALHEEDRLRWRPLAWVRKNPFRIALLIVGGLLGFFIAGYTGVLLSVTNRPIWADSNLLGVLFLLSGASTAAALLVLLGKWQVASHGTVRWLNDFDSWVLWLELAAIVVFLISLGSVFRVWLSGWGVVLVLGVIIAGILVPLALHYRPGRFSRWTRRPEVAAALLVLIGGLLLRVSVLFASAGVDATRFGDGL